MCDSSVQEVIDDRERWEREQAEMKEKCKYIDDLHAASNILERSTKELLATFTACPFWKVWLWPRLDRRVCKCLHIWEYINAEWKKEIDRVYKDVVV